MAESTRVQARNEHGGKPAPKKPAQKKPAQKRTTQKKAAPKKAAPKKPAPKKAAQTKPAPKKAAPNKAAPKKPVQKSGRRGSDPGDGDLSRRSVVLGGSVLVAGTGFIVAGALDLFPVDVPQKPPGGSAEAPKSRVIGTADWGARPPDRKAKVNSGPPRYIVVHHTSTRNVEDYSLAWAYRLAQGIQNFHMGPRRGWGDTGQHFTISRGGYILEGRHGSFAAARKGDMVVGTHVRNANDYTVGIECEGNYNTVLPPHALLDSLVKLCAWLCVQYELDPRKAIVPHRKFNKTDCCGDKFAPTLPRLREAVAKSVPQKLLG